MTMPHLRITVPSIVTVDTITDLLDNYRIFDLTTHSLSKITFDFSDVTFISPTGLTCLVALMKYSKHTEIADKYFLRESQYTGVTKYLERMDFYKQFGIERNTITRNSLKTHLCELCQVASERDSDRITEQLSKIIQEKLNLSDDMYYVVSYSIGEVLNNVFHHSQSPIHGFACAQTFPNMGYLELAVADCGIGIKESLRGNPLYNHIITDEEAIRSALGKRVTSKPDSNAGEGLFLTKRFIKENNGEMSIFSGISKIKVTHQQELSVPHPYWKGTLVSLIMRLDTQVNVTKILTSEFPEDAPDDDDNDLFGDIFN